MGDPRVVWNEVPQRVWRGSLQIVVCTIGEMKMKKKKKEKKKKNRVPKSMGIQHTLQVQFLDLRILRHRLQQRRQAVKSNLVVCKGHQHTQRKEKKRLSNEIWNMKKAKTHSQGRDTWAQWHPWGNQTAARSRCCMWKILQWVRVRERERVETSERIIKILFSLFSSSF